MTIDTVKKSEYNSKFRRTFIRHLIMIAISLIIVVLGLLWQWSLSITAWCNAFWLAFSIYLLIVWTIFIYNQNVLSSFIHSAKTFGLMLVGKRPKLKYSEYKLQVEENKIPSIYGRLTVAYGFIMFLISIGLLIYIEIF